VFGGSRPAPAPPGRHEALADANEQIEEAVHGGHSTPVPRLFQLYNPLMPAPLRYPCFLPVDPGGKGHAPHLIAVDKVKCIVILTNNAAADAYFRRKFGAEAKSRAVVWTFGEPAGLLK
jgi:hypothetical protein